MITKIKFCGLRRPEDIAAANELMPDYIGFVFAPSSRRQVTPAQAAALKTRLAPGILTVGVFVNEPPAAVAALLCAGVIDLAQLHGDETEEYRQTLRTLTEKPIIQAFSIRTPADLTRAEAGTADYLLLDSGPGGTGTAFRWELAKTLHRPYFLAGGLDGATVGAAIRTLHPYGVDVSSGIETNGIKDPAKMAAFVAAARKEDTL